MHVPLATRLLHMDFQGRKLISDRQLAWGRVSFLVLGGMASF